MKVGHLEKKAYSCLTGKSDPPRGQSRPTPWFLSRCCLAQTLPGGRSQRKTLYSGSTVLVIKPLSSRPQPSLLYSTLASGPLQTLLPLGLGNRKRSRAAGRLAQEIPTLLALQVKALHHSSCCGSRFQHLSHPALTPKTASWRSRDTTGQGPHQATPEIWTPTSWALPSCELLNSDTPTSPFHPPHSFWQWIKCPSRCREGRLIQLAEKKDQETI